MRWTPAPASPTAQIHNQARQGAASQPVNPVCLPSSLVLVCSPGQVEPTKRAVARPSAPLARETRKRTGPVPLPGLQLGPGTVPELPESLLAARSLRARLSSQLSGCEGLPRLGGGLAGGRGRGAEARLLRWEVQTATSWPRSAAAPPPANNLKQQGSLNIVIRLVMPCPPAGSWHPCRIGIFHRQTDCALGPPGGMLLTVLAS